LIFRETISSAHKLWGIPLWCWPAFHIITSCCRRAWWHYRFIPIIWYHAACIGSPCVYSGILTQRFGSSHYQSGTNRMYL